MRRCNHLSTCRRHHYLGHRHPTLCARSDPGGSVPFYPAVYTLHTTTPALLHFTRAYIYCIRTGDDLCTCKTVQSPKTAYSYIIWLGEQ